MFNSTKMCNYHRHHPICHQNRHLHFHRRHNHQIYHRHLQVVRIDHVAVLAVANQVAIPTITMTIVLAVLHVALLEKRIIEFCNVISSVFELNKKRCSKFCLLLCVHFQNAKHKQSYGSLFDHLLH